MSKTANIFTRVDPKVKEQAETVLSQLGLSMATAMEIYLRQIALKRKIPFEMSLPAAKPIALGSLSDEEFNTLMDESAQDYSDGKFTPLEDFRAELKEDLGI